MYVSLMSKIYLGGMGIVWFIVSSFISNDPSTDWLITSAERNYSKRRLL